MMGGMMGNMMGGGRDRSRSPAPRMGGMMGGMSNAGPKNLNQFVAQHGLDANAAEALMNANPQEQALTMHLIDLAVSSGNARNPSAVAWSKIKQVQENPNEAKKDYLSKVLDEKVMTAFAEIPPETQ